MARSNLRKCGFNGKFLLKFKQFLLLPLTCCLSAVYVLPAKSPFCLHDPTYLSLNKTLYKLPFYCISCVPESVLGSNYQKKHTVKDLRLKVVAQREKATCDP